MRRKLKSPYGVSGTKNIIFAAVVFVERQVGYCRPTTSVDGIDICIAGGMPL